MMLNSSQKAQKITFSAPHQEIDANKMHKCLIEYYDKNNYVKKPIDQNLLET